MALATASEVAARLGGDEFTGAKLAQATSLIGLASGLVLDAVDKTTEWATAQAAEIPAALNAVTIEAVARVMANPAGARSQSKTLGQFTSSTSWADANTGLVLTDAEVTRCRRAVYGLASGSARPRSVLDDLLPDCP